MTISIHPAGCPRSTSECPGLHACNLCKALEHGMQSCSSPGSCTWPLPPPSMWKEEVGQGKGAEGAGQVAVTFPFPLTPWKRLVVEPGCGKRGNPCAGNDY